MSTDTVFWSFAIIGTTFFILRSLLIFSGFAHEVGGDIYHDTDSASGTEGSFKLLSSYSLAAFIMMFGWAGLAANSQYELSSGVSIFVGFAVGGLSMFLTAFLMRSLLGLSTPGAVFRIEDTVGLKANVYERIPANGIGQVQLSVGGMIREIQARSESETEIDSFQSVEVIRVIDPQTISVRTIH